MNSISNILNFSIGSVTVEKILQIMILVLVCYIVSKILMHLFGNIMKKKSLDPSIQIFLMTGLKVLLMFVSIIIITGSLGIPTTSLVALLSVVSLAISLSIQGLLTNVASGLTILFTHPFAVGDFIELDTLSGKVTQTGLIYTQLLTPENKTVFLPNSQVCGGRIVNYTRQDERRVDLMVTASYNASPDAVKAALFEAIHAYPHLLDSPAPEVYINDYLESTIQYVARAWVPTDLYWDAHFTILEEVKKAFDRNGVAMDYPHMNIHMIGDIKNEQ